MLVKGFLQVIKKCAHRYEFWLKKRGYSHQFNPPYASSISAPVLIPGFVYLAAQYTRVTAAADHWPI